jgi:hypothetical protein
VPERWDEGFTYRSLMSMRKIGLLPKVFRRQAA